MFVRSLFLALLLATIVAADIDFSTCARMDVPILKKAAQGLCITSCSMQNCGTGSCKKRSGRPTCVCYRCANGGGDIPLGALIKRG